ncbi:uncharacterized protein LOC121370774 [Gigantopelta aegis]|uniref:uncharacterized protein LOC121370774 n=1 Tax=Gigantopelta aegis TaxID=1735272 RepID=UPI001B887926|nr:uncharacterized protein LOC121370774 [Gigantopelta aegis]
MRLCFENVAISLPPTLGAVLCSLGRLSKYRIEHNGDSATVTLYYGNEKKKRATSRRRRRRPKSTQGEPNLAAQPPGAAPPVPKRRTRRGTVQGDPNPVAQLPGAVHSASPDTPTRPKHSPGTIQGGPKLSAQLTVEAPPVEGTTLMDTGHVVVLDPPDSPPPPPVAVVGVVIQRESKRRKMSSVTSPKKSDQTDWTLVCDKLPAKYREAVIGDFTDPQQLKGPWSNKQWRQLPSGQGKYQIRGSPRSKQLYVTAQQDGLYRQGLLKAEMPNATIHRILKLVLRDIYTGVLERNIEYLMEGLPNLSPDQPITSP